MPQLIPSPLTRPSRWLALALAAVVFGLGLLAVAPEVHEHLHDDAAHPEHFCAIDLFAQGVAAATAGLTVVVAVEVWAQVSPAPIMVRVPAPAHRLPPGRGPPIV